MWQLQKILFFYTKQRKEFIILIEVLIIELSKKENILMTENVKKVIFVNTNLKTLLSINFKQKLPEISDVALIVLTV